jgi:sugar phosphate permease
MQLWYPRHERGFCQGITHSASRLGAAITPPLVVLIMTTLGWRWVFYISAAIGIVWSALWYLAYRNLPEEHGLVNKAELEHIRGIDGTEKRDPSPMATKRSGYTPSASASSSRSRCENKAYLGDEAQKAPAAGTARPA